LKARDSQSPRVPRLCHRTYAKDFDHWNDAEPSAVQPIDFVNERQVWWASLGINIGSEQDG
jgi:hypothetical protein